MRRRSRIGLFLALSLVVASPAFPQGNEAKDWQAIQEQKDQKKKTEMLEAYIKKYPTSTRRPGADADLVDQYAKTNDNSKVLSFAEAYKKQPPSPDTAAAAKIYSQAMLSAYSEKDIKRAAEFGEAAIAADPNHFP